MKELEASCLAQHSMHPVDGESCFRTCVDKMAAVDVAKGGCPDDADGGEATWWRPREPCTRWSFAIAWRPGRSSGMVELLAASSTLELRDQRRSNVAM